MFEELLVGLEENGRTDWEVVEMLEKQLGTQATGKVADGSNLSCLLILGSLKRSQKRTWECNYIVAKKTYMFFF